jgi:hypothetical protein
VILELLPLAIGSAAYPTLLAMVVLILGRPNPRRILAAYLAGGMAASVIVGFVVVKSLKAGNVVGGSDRTVGPGVDVAIGLIALVLFWVLLTNRDAGFRERRAAKKEAKAADAKESWTSRALSGGSLKLMFVAGMALNLPGALYLVALKDIAAADADTAEVIGLLLFYNVVMFQWAEIPLIGFSVAPEGTRRLIDGVNGWLGRNGRRIAMVLCGLAAAYLIYRGLHHALS